MMYYQTHRETGEYLNAGIARQSPLWKDNDPDNERWLIPGGAYTDAPPAAGAGFAIVRQGEAWVQIEDHRGETWWRGHGDPVTIAGLGPIPDGLTSTEPPDNSDG